MTGRPRVRFGTKWASMTSKCSPVGAGEPAGSRRPAGRSPPTGGSARSSVPGARPPSLGAHLSRRFRGVALLVPAVPASLACRDGSRTWPAASPSGLSALCLDATRAGCGTSTCGTSPSAARCWSTSRSPDGSRRRRTASSSTDADRLPAGRPAARGDRRGAGAASWTGGWTTARWACDDLARGNVRRGPVGTRRGGSLGRRYAAARRRGRRRRPARRPARRPSRAGRRPTAAAHGHRRLATGRGRAAPRSRPTRPARADRTRALDLRGGRRAPHRAAHAARPGPDGCGRDY